MENRRIRCHKVGGHGAETFVEGVQNSCNPVFIDIGLRLGADRFYEGFRKIGLMDKTGVDLPGEAGTIMHNKSNIGPVELATMSFGQSFQITPIQLATTVSSIINGGRRVMPHLGVQVTDRNGKTVEKFDYPVKKHVVSEDTSLKMRTYWKVLSQRGPEKIHIFRDIKSVEKLQHPRHFREVQINIFHRLLVLLRRIIRKFLRWW